jgi:predicted GNAT family acetyltransferase
MARDLGQPLRRDPAASVDAELAEGRVVLRRSAAGEIVSMAAYGGATPHGIRIRKVYTPPPHRRRGYARSLVADLSGRLLAAGRSFCCLYADRANPAANDLCVRIGHQAVGDVDDYVVTSGP